MFLFVAKIVPVSFSFRDVACFGFAVASSRRVAGACFFRSVFLTSSRCVTSVVSGALGCEIPSYDIA